MKVILHKDGSLEFPEGLPPGLLLRDFKAEDNRFVPKFALCVLRINNCRMSACGKRVIFQWHCSHFNVDVNTITCGNCNVRRSS